ncbi:MAG TPA: hypothetical protein VEL31_19530 [Ktedonobacteraceae bacterium]|nr:hypothetical protein [Ktedonobacteraceae bacterium]
MAKNKINEMLQKKDPAALRRERTPVPAVDILDAAAQDVETEQKNVQEIPDKKVEVVQRTEKEFAQLNEKIYGENIIEKREEEISSGRGRLNTGENKRTKKDFRESVRNKSSEKAIQKRDRPSREKKARIYSERDIQSVLAIEKRATKRYSFEIYVDQVDDIQRICELYEEANPDKKLSASRLIREVLDSFLSDALKAFEKIDE